MKKLLLALLIIGVVSVSSFASEKKFGIGLAAGSITGISMKYWTAHTEAIEIEAGWSLKHNSYYSIYATYLFHNFKTLRELVSKEILGDIPIYTGLGIRTRFGEGTDELGLRVPLGVAYMFGTLPLDTFVEVAPALNLYPSTTLYVDVVLGVRYYF